eukprot:gnl/Chilomastix_cuspidata/4496.p1 GENE.gnl/Chilomastix_cuspidata/4496~~gnl/Chilomastix_cuspidata/4496.p1  ORF type:complete len:202 (-),score=71.04 gnl/Chilomastix_cuspidata/4496:16-621(-)
MQPPSEEESSASSAQRLFQHTPQIQGSAKSSKSFTDKQRNVLQSVFKVKPYLKPKNPDEYAILAERIGITSTQCRTWFQNHRSRQREKVMLKKSSTRGVISILEEVLEAQRYGAFDGGDATAAVRAAPDDLPRGELIRLFVASGLLSPQAAAHLILRGPSPEPLPDPQDLRRLQYLIQEGPDFHESALEAMLGLIGSCDGQ